MKCTKVLENNLISYRLIKSHLDEHLWCNNIKNETDGFIDFANKYAWMIREVYCISICSNKDKCEAPKIKPPQITDDLLYKIIKKYEAEKYVEVLFLITKKHIDQYKWYRKINNYKDAIKSFLEEYGWIAEELLDQKYAKGDNDE
jgi:hypothetical protein